MQYNFHESENQSGNQDRNRPQSPKGLLRTAGLRFSTFFSHNPSHLQRESETSIAMGHTDIGLSYDDGKVFTRGNTAFFFATGSVSFIVAWGIGLLGELPSVIGAAALAVSSAAAWLLIGRHHKKMNKNHAY